MNAGAVTLLAACLCLPTVCAAAAVHQYFLDPATVTAWDQPLDQHDIANLPNPFFGCGPAAATNAFAYLDQGHLIPRASPPRPLYEDMVATADALSQASYMGTTEAGTTVTQFITGVDKYLSNYLARGTRQLMAAQMAAAWSGDAKNPKPAFVSDTTAPTWQFLLSELEKGWAVQLGLDGRNPDGTRGGHWLSITGFYFADFDFDDIIDQGTDMAYIRYVDPWSGQTGQADVWLRPGSTLLGSNYVGSAHGSTAALRFDDVRLIAVVAEQVPEPGTLALAVLALGVCALAMTRARSPLRPA